MSSAQVRAVEKVLSANDVGETHSHQAGMHIPKVDSVLQFFPALNPKVKNPDTVMVVKDPLTGAHWNLRYVYYNGRLLNDGTRNEYRLTGITGMLRAMGARRGDTLKFTRSTSGEILVSLVPIDHEDAEPVLTTEPGVLPGGWRIVAVEEE